MNNWRIRGNKVNINSLAKLSNTTNLTAKILANRGITTPEQVIEFINPKIQNLHNAQNMKDLKKALDFIIDTIKANKKIAIYGDYDADGITSTVILYRAFKRLGADVIYYIPDREAEGYGINIESVYKLYKLNIATIFTCDNGIAAIYEIEEAKKLGMNVIVLDHHEVRFDEDNNQLLPNADAIIDPKRTDCDYPFKKMCAGAISYRFVIELYKAMNIPLEEAKNFIIYATIATICDIVDLVGENRIIVKKGLELLNSIKDTNLDIGLKYLIEQTGLTNKKIGVYQIGFILGPCINATGRLEQATTAVKLFTTTDSNEAFELSAKLVELNESRKNMTSIAVEKVLKSIEQSDFKRDKVLVVYDENIHESIAGIVAGKVRENYYLPTIILTKGDKMAKGSARSIEEYNIFEELCKCSELLDKFGGHPMAAGMSLEYKNIDLLRQKLNANCKLTDEDIIPKIKIDVRLPLDYISFELVHEVEKLAPFGKGNELPLFAQKNIPVLRIDFIGKEKNILKLLCISDNKKYFTAISFDGYNNFKAIIINKYGQTAFNNMLSNIKPNFDLYLDMIYTVNINEYNGNQSLQMLIKDLRISES